MNSKLIANLQSICGSLSLNGPTAGFLCVLLSVLGGTQSVSGQAALNGAGGLNMGNSGQISDAPAIVNPSTISGVGTSWEFAPDFQDWVAPVANFTGLGPNNVLLNYEDLLPLKVTKIRVMTGAAGAAPTGVGTIIDSVGIDTTSLITDALLITDATTQLPVSFSLSGGMLGLTNGLTLTGGWQIRTTTNGGLNVGGWSVSTSGLRSIALGGLLNTVSGPYSATVGGRSNVIGSGSDYSGHLAGGFSTIESDYSAVVGGRYHLIAGANSFNSAIMAGTNHTISNTAGSNNAIVAGNMNSMTAGAYASGIFSGAFNQMNGAGFQQAILGGQNNLITRSPNSVILGGLNNTISAIHPISGYEAHTSNAIVGGLGNTISVNGTLSGILAGESSTVSGQASAVLASSGAVASGLNAVVIGGSGSKAENLYASLVTGAGTVGSGNCQVTSGIYNAPFPGALLVIGNGSSNTSRSNALTVDVGGNVQASGAVQSVSITASGAVQAGSVSTTGQVQAASGRFTGKVRLQPQGGLSMGEFQYDPENP